MYILITCLLVAVVVFAPHRRQYVKFGMKVFGATVFLEAADSSAPPKAQAASFPSIDFEPAQTPGLVPRSDINLIERPEAK